MALTKPSTTAISGRRLRGLRGSSPAKREVSCARPVSGRAGSQDLFYDSTPVGKTFGRGVFLSQWLAFPVFPFPLFRIPPACRTARFVLWPGAGTKKPPGNRRLSLSWSRGGLVPENLLLCHGLDRAEGLEVVQVEILDVAQNAVNVFASLHPFFLCGLDVGERHLLRFL